VSEGLGWVATAVFCASYFVRRRQAMLAIQTGAALLWVGYGALTHATPVVAANAIVMGSALWSLWRVRDTAA
jgi:hypothetical protein